MRFSTCLAIDGSNLWVGTTQGAIRWSLPDFSYHCFSTEGDWTTAVAGKQRGRDVWISKFQDRSSRNRVEKITVLVPGAVWIDTLDGAIAVRNDSRTVYKTVEEALAALYKTDLRDSLGKVTPMDRFGNLWLTQSGSTWETRKFDGHDWKTQPEHFTCLTVGEDGLLWAGNGNGVFRQHRDGWDKAFDTTNTDGIFELLNGDHGEILALGTATASRYDGHRWTLFHERGQGFPLCGSAWVAHSCGQTSKGSWLIATGSAHAFGNAGTLSRGQLEVTATSPAFTAATRDPSGKLVLALCTPMLDGFDGFLREKEDGWAQQPKPAGDWLVFDMTFASDGTLYAATSDGVLRFQNNKWDAIIWPKGPTAIKAEEEDDD